MQLKRALGILSKSSPYAVSTLRKNKELDHSLKLKDYLYVESQIEHDFKNALKLARSRDIIYLCGSSGDGKSEVLTNCYDLYKSTIHFHLDATHSSGQHSSAVECLNELFKKYKSESFILAIGINIGMMQKFIKFGSKEHDDIKNSLISFFQSRHIKGYRVNNCSFFDFESYPRLDFKQNKIDSDFVKKFLSKLTISQTNNPFWLAYENSSDSNHQIYKNFSLLSLPEIQDSLIKLFGLVRLYDEQFLIPRTFVDYIYQILTLNNNALADNVFSVFDNELSKKISKLDPADIRNENLDDFILKYSTNTLETSIKEEIQRLQKTFGGSETPNSIIRLVYLLNNKSDNPLSRMLWSGYPSKTLTLYLELYELSQKEMLTEVNEERYEEIIEDIIIKSLFLFSNRDTPDFGFEYMSMRFIDVFNIGIKVQIDIDYNMLGNENQRENEFIPIYLIINDKKLPVFNVDLKLFHLMINITNGFKPNLQEKGILIKLQKLLASILSLASDSGVIKISERNSTTVITDNGRRYIVENS